MIRPLSEADRGPAVELLATDPHLNLYFLGNIAANGFGHNFCQFWGEFDRQGQLRAVLNRYMNGWVIFGLPAADWAALGTVVDHHPVQAERLQDNPGGIESFLPYVHRYQSQRLDVAELMAMHPQDFRPIPPPTGITIQRATVDDFDALVAYYAQAEEMARSPAAVLRPLRDRRIWTARRDGEIVATALTNAELEKMAMIGGVYTLTEQRGRGLSQAVCSALCAELLDLGKEPVLYWENSIAGAVYRKLGFHPIGKWRSARLVPQAKSMV